MCYRRAPLSGSKVSLVAERVHTCSAAFGRPSRPRLLGCYLQPRLPRERGSHEHYDPGAFNQVFDETFYLGITAIFKDLAVYLVVIILGTSAVTSYLPVAFAVILPDETYYLEEMHQPPTNAGALPLQEYRRDVPPGWNPGDPAY